jgi:hypothetical protein
VAAALLLGLALTVDSPRGGGSPSVERKYETRTRGTVEVLVRARVRVVDAQDEPVPGARVVVAPSEDAIGTEEDIARVRRGIDIDLAQGYRTWDFAIGSTNQHGVADLEYVQLAEADDPLFERADEWTSTATEKFPFSAIVRVDGGACQSVFSELHSARGARYRRYRRTEGSKGPWRVAEAEFLINCARAAPLDGTRESQGSDAAEAARVGKMVREAQGRK